MDATLRHVGIITEKVEEDIKFLKWFGFRIAKRTFDSPVPGVNLYKVLMRDKNGGTIELLRGKWWPHIAVTTRDPDAKNKIWLDFGKKWGDLGTFWQTAHLENIVVKAPGGWSLEIVNDKRVK